MPWYDYSLLHHLENVHVPSGRDRVGVRFPSQYLIRPKAAELHDFRGMLPRQATALGSLPTREWGLPSAMTTRKKQIDYLHRGLPGTLIR